MGSVSGSSRLRESARRLGQSVMGLLALCLLGSCVLPEAAVDETVAGGGSGGGGTCTAPGVACSLTSQCCQSGDGIGEEGAVCGSDGSCHAGCTLSSQCKSNCCTTLPGQTEKVCAAATYCESGPPLGSICGNNGECASGLCANGGSGTGWCSRTCTTQSDCPNEPLMVCLENSGGSKTCFVTCVAVDDCTKYGAKYSCKTAGSFDVCSS